MLMHWQHSIWMTNASAPGTLFYFLSAGGNQPNAAGLYGAIVSNPFYIILLLFLSRLVVKFSILSVCMASSLDEKIMPAHPDNTGGLLPVGQAMLFFSVPLMLIGLSIAIGNVMDVFVWKRHLSQIVYVWWTCYISVGPLLFFLPLLPLRHLMYKSKHGYLSRLRKSYRELETNTSDIENKDILAHQINIGTMIERAERMSVWPFDRATFLRFSGVFLSPLFALAASKWPEFVQQFIGHYFGAS